MDPAALRAGLGRGCVRFRQDEDGAGTAFGFFGIVICLMLAGVSVDFTNAWRNGEILRLSADVAAHAGASTLAQDGDRMAALAVATGATELNTPAASYGRVIYDPFEDIEALHYDPDSNMVSPGGVTNAVSVRLQRNARVQNPVPTFLLRLVGRNSWDISVTSVAAVVPTTRCLSGDGIYARHAVTLEGQAVVGADVCIHSQTAVRLSGGSSFDGGSGLSMPDLANCRGGCSETSSPGYGAASAEANLIMSDPSDHIDRLTAGFTDAGVALPEEAAFFAIRPLAEDLSALDELGVDTAELSGGDVIRLDAETFDRARALPAGLVYLVTCPRTGEGTGVLSIGGRPLEVPEDGAGAETAAGETGGGGDELVEPVQEDAISPEDEMAEEGQVLNGVVLVTDCLLQFTDLANIRGSMILSTRAVSGVALRAEEGARVGDPELQCAPAHQSVIMAKGGMQVPAGFTASNTAFVMDGDITVAGAPSGATAAHRGLSLHASGQVTMNGQHAFTACGTALAGLLPLLNVIKFVIPTDPLIATN